MTDAPDIEEHSFCMRLFVKAQQRSLSWRALCLSLPNCCYAKSMQYRLCQANVIAMTGALVEWSLLLQDQCRLPLHTRR